MLKQYSVHALCRAEGAIGEFSKAVFNLKLERDPNPWLGQPLVKQAIATIRNHGYETLHIEKITEELSA